MLKPLWSLKTDYIVFLFYSIDNAGNQEAEKNSTFLLQQKSLINITIKGGFGISATIKNTGTTNFTNIDGRLLRTGNIFSLIKTKAELS